MKDIIILGAGGEALEIIQVIKLINQKENTWNILGYLDDNHKLIGTDVSDYKVLGTIDDSANFPNAYFISSIGHPNRPELRGEIRKRIPFGEEKLATVIHPTVVVCPTAKIGYGCFIQANCVISTNTVIGNNVLISYSSTLGHESTIQNDTVVGVNVTITSDVHIGKCVYIGPGAIFRNDLSIGDNTLIGIGSVVVESVPENTKYICQFRSFKFPKDEINPYEYE
jgi:sugar O-acyltransferase (sialic acid O-acetyltransferase NeuD family)